MKKEFNNKTTEKIEEKYYNKGLIISNNFIYSSSEISNLSSYNIINLPLKSFEFISFSNFENDSIKESSLSCGIFNHMKENIFSLSNLIKSLSLLTNTLSLDFEKEANLPLDSPFGFVTTSYPSESKNINNLFFTFSSKRNSILLFNSDNDIVSTLCYTTCIMQGSFNMLSCQGGYKIFNYFFEWHSCLKQLQNLPNHNSSTFKSRSSPANFRVCNYIFINFYSHLDSINNYKLFKSFLINLIVKYFYIFYLKENKGVYKY